MSVSGVQESDSGIHSYTEKIFRFFPIIGLLQGTENSSLCYTVGFCCLSVLYAVVCIC